VLSTSPLPILIALIPLDNSSSPIFVIVLLSASIVLFVKVSVLSNNETVPVAFGNVIVLSAVGSTTVKFVS